jgi:hypothetical protein
MISFLFSIVQVLKLTPIEGPPQSFSGCHSKESCNQGNLPSYIPFVHSLQLPFPHTVHDLVAL